MYFFNKPLSKTNLQIVNVAMQSTKREINNKKPYRKPKLRVMGKFSTLTLKMGSLSDGLTDRTA